MTLPYYLQSLQTFQNIIQIQSCANLALQAFEHEPIDSNLIDKLRGELLRTLKTILQFKAQNNGLFYTLKHYGWTFFAPAQNFRRLEDLLSSEIKPIEDKIIVALQGLAKKFPIDDVDPFDLEPIEEDENYWLSLKGRKYRLETLAEWIRSRKAFIYPDDNKEMFLQDIENLKELCKLHEISLKPAPVYSETLKQEIIEAGFSLAEIRGLAVPGLRSNHIKALRMLMTDYHLSKREAFEELSGLNYEQAEALNALYADGLRGEHLRNLMIDESEYSPHHTVVLQMLINEQDYDVDTAIYAISNCDADEVQQFYSMSSRL